MKSKNIFQEQFQILIEKSQKSKVDISNEKPPKFITLSKQFQNPFGTIVDRDEIDIPSEKNK